MSDIYIENGYESKEHYLDSLRNDYGKKLVDRLLPKFPETELFGTFITALEESHYSTTSGDVASTETPVMDEDDDEDFDEEDFDEDED